MIQWGYWQYNGGNGMRVGIDLSTSPVTHSSTTVTFTAKIYTQNQYTYSGDTMQLDYYDDIAGPSFVFTNNEGSTQVLRDTKTLVYTYSTYGSSPGYRVFNATISGENHGNTPFESIAGTIPGRPVGGPADPTALTAVRNSDTQATLNWTRNPTGPQPYTTQTVGMQRWDGATGYDNPTPDPVASIAGTATSYVRTTLTANHAYLFSVRAENSQGSSGWATSNVVFTTPAAPSGVVSVLSGTGTSITTTWTDNAFTYPGVGTWTIQRSVNGGAFTNIGTVGSKTPTSFTDGSLGAGTNAYRVAAVVGALQSAYATGNTVAAPAAPAAPTLLSPNGTFVDFVANIVTFTWQHNPGATGAAQTHFTIETSINSGSTWVALAGATNVASAVSSFALPAGTLSNGVPYLWRVRTQGVTTAGFSANSASAAVQGYTKPTVTLSLPTATTNTFPIRAAWVYAQAELLPQVAYTALLFAADGVTLLEEIDGFDATNAVSFTYATVTGNSYVVRVRGMSSAGIWSNFAEVTTSFVLLPPTLAIATGEFQACAATVLLHLSSSTVTPGTNVAIESVMVERRVAGGNWVILAAGLLVPTEFLDTLPLTNGLNEYKITAVSATPSTAVSPILQVYGNDGANDGDSLWVWVSYGDNFEFDLRVHGDLSISETTGRVKAVQHFLGRAKPVALVGQNTNRTLALSGSLFFDRRCVPTILDTCLYDSTPPQWRDAGTDSEVVCYRDFTGRRIFGTLSDVTVSDGPFPGHASISCAVTEVDFTERYIQLVTA